MGTITDHPLLWLIAIAALLASDVLLFLLGYALRRCAKDTAEEGGAQSSRANPPSMTPSLQRLHEGIARLEERVAGLESRQDQIEVRGPEGHSYGVAMRLVSSGADISELMSVCGLTRGEAELIAKLHEMNGGSSKGAA